MKISNISPIKYNFDSFNSNIHKYSSKPKLNENKNKKGSEVYFSGEYYHSLLNIDNKKNVSSNNITFGNLYHKTISSKVPVYRPCCSTYDDIDEFSRQFCEKINSQIQNPSIEDVERLIENVKKETGADERLVKEVVFRLSQFSSFKSLKYIDEILENNNEEITRFAPWHCLSNSLMYLGEKFNYFHNTERDLLVHLKKCNPYTPVSFIDDFGIKGGKLKVEEKYPITFKQYFGKKSYILDGFDVLTSEGKYCGANFMSGTGYLEALSIDVIKQIQNGKDIEDIMHGDLEKRFKKEFKEGIYGTHEIKVIKKKKPLNITSKDILKNLKEKELKPDFVKESIRDFAQSHIIDFIFELEDYAAIGKLLKKSKNPAKSLITEINEMLKTKLGKESDDAEKIENEIRSEIETAVMKYLDCFTTVFSAHSMSQILFDMGYRANKTEKGTGRKNFYYIPNLSKSSSLLTYMFMKNNEIDFNRGTVLKETFYNDRDNFFIIEDNSISGESQIQEICSLADTDSENIYFSSIFSCDSAIKNAYYSGFRNSIPYIVGKDMIEAEDDFLSCKKDKRGQTPKKWNMSQREWWVLSHILKRNYKESGTAVAFPYILPDNNSDFASTLLEPLLVESTSNSKKS